MGKVTWERGTRGGPKGGVGAVPPGSAVRAPGGWD